MKINNIFIAAIACAVALSSCNNDDEKGGFTLEFDNYFGEDDMKLKTSYDTTDFDHKTHAGQDLNITKCAYYVTNIKLEGPDGEVFLDPVESSASADKVKGFYQVQESLLSSQEIVLSEVPVGKYDKITFDIGIPESAVQEGAQGGVLDVAEGALFWNWNAGYIGLALEGTSPLSAQAQGISHNKYDVKLHIGGWKDEGDFVNNVKTVSLDFPSEVEVMEGSSPHAHIIADFKMLLMMAEVDFAETYHVHSPAKGENIAGHIPHIFNVHHIHAH